MDPVPSAFQGASTSMVSDALDELGIDGVLPGLVPRHGDRRSVGRAFPVAFEPIRHDAAAYRFGGGVGRPLEAVLQAMKTGHFILFDLRGSERAACWGGLASRLAAQQGVRGVAVWGSCRDVADIAEQDFPVWSSSISPRRSRNDFTFGSMDEPIEIAEVATHPGDVVVADSSGVVIVPHTKETDVLKVLQQVIDQEHDLERRLRTGQEVDWDAV